MPDYSKFAFHSDFNYLKRDPDLVGSTVLTLGGYGSVASHVVNHNYGYVPFVLVYSQIDNTDTLWLNDKPEAGTFDYFDLSYPTTEYYVDETKLTIELHNDTTPVLATGNRRIWWIVYKDKI